MSLWIDPTGAVIDDTQPYVATDGTTYPGQWPKAEIAELTEAVETERPDTAPTGYTVDGQARGGVIVTMGDDGREWEVVDCVQVWRTTPRPIMTEAETEAVAARDVKASAQAALDKSDTTIVRCAEKGVAVPMEWASYRDTLRAIITDKSPGPLPERPAWPAGT